MAGDTFSSCGAITSMLRDYNESFDIHNNNCYVVGGTDAVDDSIVEAFVLAATRT